MGPGLAQGEPWYTSRSQEVTRVATLSGPSRLPKSGGAPDSVVVMLHGRGSNGEDLISLADIFAERLPTTAFHSPDAPFPFTEGGFGYQWFARDPTETRDERVREVEGMVNDYIAELLGEYALGPSRCVLLGFSQGCMVSIHLAPRRKEQLAGVVAISGAMITGDTLAEEAASKPPFVFIHGADDQVLPSSDTDQAAERFEELGFPVTKHILPGLGHGIDQRGFDIATGFIKQVLG